MAERSLTLMRDRDSPALRAPRISISLTSLSRPDPFAHNLGLTSCWTLFIPDAFNPDMRHDREQFYPDKLSSCRSTGDITCARPAEPASLLQSGILRLSKCHSLR